VKDRKQQIFISTLIIAGLFVTIFYGIRKIGYDIFLNIGSRAEERGDIPNAIKNLNKAARFAWSQSSIYARIGDAAIREHDAILVNKKDSALGKEGSLDISVSNFMKALEYNPQNPWAWSGISEYFERKSYLVERPDLINISKLSYGDFGKLDYEDWMAIATVKKAIELEPNSYFYHDLLGFIFMENNIAEQALEHYELAIELYPIVEDHFFIPEREIPEEMNIAIENGLKKALERNELIGKAKIYYELGQWMLYQRRYSEAAAYFKNAMNEGYEKYVILGKLGIIHFQQKSYGQSLEFLLESIQGDHNKSYEMYLIGKIFCRKGDHSRALTYFKLAKNDAIKTQSKQYYLFSIAKEYEHLKSFTDAESAYLEAVRIYPDNAVAYSKIIEFYQKIGNYEEAEKYRSLESGLKNRAR
jgi:tetratricopeptide (TPR) repeat protein